MIPQIDKILDGIRVTQENYFKGKGQFRTFYHVYGRNGVLGDFEPQKSITSHELGLVMEAVAESQQLAHEICEDFLLRLTFWRYEGRQTTAGNCAVLFSPTVIDVGETYKTAIYHVLPLEDPCEPFRMNVRNISAF